MEDKGTRDIGTGGLPKVNQARERLYAFFSRLVGEEPDSDCLQALRSVQPEIGALAHSSGQAQFREGAGLLRDFVQQLERLPDGQREELLLELRSQHATLFLLGEPPGLSPYESVHHSRGGILMQGARDRVLAAYREARLLPTTRYREPEDHLGTELEFMAHLCRRATNGDIDQARFLQEHLLTWVPQLCSQFKEAAASALYAAVAELLAGFLIMEARFMSSDQREQTGLDLSNWMRELGSIARSSNWHYFTGGKRVLQKAGNSGNPGPVAEKVVPSGCSVDCGARCPLNVHVKDGRIIKIMPGQPDLTEARPCAKGLLFNYRVYSPDRIKYPMKRVGERGEGKFVRISWDEALDTVAKEIVRIRDTYGAAAIFSPSYGGGHGMLHNRGSIWRLLNMAGGCTVWWATASVQGGIFSALTTYGTPMSGNERDDLLNARMIILWGSNPVESMSGTPTRWYLTLAKEKGINIVCVDPRYTGTADTFASKWIPIRPGTDAAMMVAMAYVIISEGLHDQRFMDTYTVGFEQFRDYVLGHEDGIAKTPSWAEQITGVAADTIAALARQYANSKPAALITGWGPGRSANGEQYHRAAAALASLTGNIGIHGGNAAGGLEVPSWIPMTGYFAVPELPNPVEEAAPPRPNSILQGGMPLSVAPVHTSLTWDAILKGKAGGYFSDIKMLYLTNGNPLVQFPDSNMGVKALQKLESIVIHEIVMTPTAKFADILLPACTWCERNDINRQWAYGPYFIYANKAIEPLFESKTDLDICIELAERLGISGYNDKTEDEWLRLCAEQHGISDYDAFKEKGFHVWSFPEPYVSFRPEIEDPEHNKFPTPSGKIEIFSQAIADVGTPDIFPPIPKYMEMWEGVNDPLKKKYPLQLITPHSRKRVHSQVHESPWHRSTEPHAMWINSADADSRGIADGDEVKVYNDRGTVMIPAKVTARIMPGVVCIYEGAWYNPDASGVDRGGCANVLTKADHSPGGAFAANTSLVEVIKA